jgi:hypothetical protein
VNKFKVKIAGLDRMKNNKLHLILAITVASIFLLIFLKFWLDEENDHLDNLFSNIGLTKPEPKEPSKIIFPQAHKPLSLEEAKLRIKLAKSKTKSALASRYVFRVEQERLLKNFQNNIHLKMNFPGYLNYTPVDLEDDVGAIMGTTTTLDQTFAVLATSRQVTLNQVVSYLKDESSTFPMLKGHEFQPQKAFKFNPPPSSGLSELTVIPSTAQNGRGLYAVLAPRADKKGNYLFMMEAPLSYFDTNEDGFEKLLDGMQAQP